MSRRSAPIYPAYAFKESPTWFKWVKLTAGDIHRLREEPGFQGQDVYFHLNHPIRYVCLTGLIVAIDDRLNKYTLLELDDGSGSVLVVKVTRLAPEIANASDCPSNTTVANVDVLTGQGRYDVLVDNVPLDMGTVVKVKCTISEFRNVRQLELKRIWILRSTAEEVTEWEESAKFKKDVLNHPWILSDERIRSLQRAEMDKLQKREETENMEDKRRRLEVAKKAKKAEMRKEHEERKEAKRRKEEDLMNAGALI